MLRTICLAALLGPLSLAMAQPDSQGPDRPGRPPRWRQGDAAFQDQAPFAQRAGPGPRMRGPENPGPRARPGPGGGPWWAGPGPGQDFGPGAGQGRGRGQLGGQQWQTRPEDAQPGWRSPAMRRGGPDDMARPRGPGRPPRGMGAGPGPFGEFGPGDGEFRRPRGGRGPDQFEPGRGPGDDRAADRGRGGGPGPDRFGPFQGDRRGPQAGPQDDVRKQFKKQSKQLKKHARKNGRAPRAEGAPAPDGPRGRDAGGPGASPGGPAGDKERTPPDQPRRQRQRESRPAGQPE